MTAPNYLLRGLTFPDPENGTSAEHNTALVQVLQRLYTRYPHLEVVLRACTSLALNMGYFQDGDIYYPRLIGDGDLYLCDDRGNRLSPEAVSTVIDTIEDLLALEEAYETTREDKPGRVSFALKRRDTADDSPLEIEIFHDTGLGIPPRATRTEAEAFTTPLPWYFGVDPPEVVAGYKLAYMAGINNEHGICRHLRAGNIIDAYGLLICQQRPEVAVEPSLLSLAFLADYPRWRSIEEIAKGDLIRIDASPRTVEIFARYLNTYTSHTCPTTPATARKILKTVEEEINANIALAHWEHPFLRRAMQSVHPTPATDSELQEIVATIRNGALRAYASEHPDIMQQFLHTLRDAVEFREETLKKAPGTTDNRLLNLAQTAPAVLVGA